MKIRRAAGNRDKEIQKKNGMKLEYGEKGKRNKKNKEEGMKRAVKKEMIKKEIQKD